MEKVLLLLATTILTASIWFLSTPNPPVANTDLNNFLYLDWKQSHNVVYDSFVIDNYRFNIFQDNLAKLQQNSAEFTTAPNQFMDISADEFHALYLNSFKIPRIKPQNYIRQHSQKFNVDWRQKNIFNEISNQGNCGGCWAFSSLAQVEALKALQNGTVPQYSKQELIDCSEDNMGCAGGTVQNAFRYLKKYEIHSEEEYPFSGKSQKCQKQTPGKTISSYDVILYADCNRMELQLLKQPITVAIDATKLQFYSSGIVSSCDVEGDLNHSVVLVGADDNSWILRNSWGQGWGEQGHVRLARGNTCGVCELPVYATL